MKRLIALILAFSVSLLNIQCSEDDPATPPPPPLKPGGEVIGKAQLWTTNAAGTQLLEEMPTVDIYEEALSTEAELIIDRTEKYQEIEGFGAALTGSSAFLINELSSGKKSALIKDLFDPKTGIGISYLRMSIGASDFSLQDFTYNDLPSGETDSNLDKFSLKEDEKDVIPVFKDILQVYPKLKIMGSPWSAPAWMKTNNSLYGGNLKQEWYNSYANYFVKYIEGYAAHGINIDAITPQNEPLHQAQYPTMIMEAGQQIDFIKDHLGPLFQSEGIETKIIAYDHNFDEPQYPIAVLSDEEAYTYVDGSAFHAYAGDVSAMSQVHNAFPEKGVYFTEISGGEWATDFGDNLKWNIKNIFIGTTRNWSKTALLWNLALDENSGPTNNGCQNCRGVVTIESSGEIIYNEEFYALAHFSKFVRPGARRIASNQLSGGIYNVAFQNPDGTIALVVLNETSSNRSINVQAGDKYLKINSTANSVSTFVW
ncbi:glycoside hydrolase family 30 protein [Salegentibacter sediminis]|uniref:glycoside hydrolase family 30 protein n=1 Tax=Salegentibacter sediminis TaxID=1930251 RepID=UPI0009BD95EC|nr:glycoside hydrolase family 30 beta sandwich domain-containing protein [Salegentibacter sediminis]